jgi:serine/threonine protein phosphatase 1
MTQFKKFAKNTTGRDLIVGDIHGHFTKLQSLLDEVGFNPEAGDRLFSVGDLVDRGPESDDALEWLAKPWFHAVQGNHEGMAIDWAQGMGDRSNYVANGGAWNIGNTPEVRQLYADAFSALPIAIELETDLGLLGIVHAGCPYNDWTAFAVDLQRDDLTPMQRDHLTMMATWSRDRINNMDDSMVSGVDAVVVGHTPMERVTSLGNTIFIDTAGWHPKGNGFTILDASTMGKASHTKKPRQPEQEAFFA